VTADVSAPGASGGRWQRGLAAPVTVRAVVVTTTVVHLAALAVLAVELFGDRRSVHTVGSSAGMSVLGVAGLLLAVGGALAAHVVGVGAWGWHRPSSGARRSELSDQARGRRPVPAADEAHVSQWACFSTAQVWSLASGTGVAAMLASSGVTPGWLAWSLLVFLLLLAGAAVWQVPYGLQGARYLKVHRGQATSVT
jgi:hypothetical protein